MKKSFNILLHLEQLKSTVVKNSLHFSNMLNVFKSILFVYFEQTMTCVEMKQAGIKLTSCLVFAF